MTRTTIRLSDALRFSLALSAASIPLTVAPAASAQSAAASGPIYVVASIDVLPQMKARGEAVIRDYVAKAKADRRISQVWFLEEVSTPNHFEVVEVMPSRQAYEEHVAQRYVIDYRDKLHPVLGSPYDERLFSDAGR